MTDPRPGTRPAPAGGPAYWDSLTNPKSFTQFLAGAQTTGNGKARFVNDTGAPLLLRQVRLTAGTAPTGADLLVDVNVNGTTAFSAQASRPKITAGQTMGSAIPAQTGNPVTVPVDGVITVDVDQVGSTVAGSDLTVFIEAVKDAAGGYDWKQLRDGYERPTVRDPELLPVDSNPV